MTEPEPQGRNGARHEFIPDPLDPDCCIADDEDGSDADCCGETHDAPVHRTPARVRAERGLGAQ